MSSGRPQGERRWRRVSKGDLLRVSSSQSRALRLHGVLLLRLLRGHRVRRRWLLAHGGVL